MKLTISQEDLSNGLQSVHNIVSSRTTLPILSNVLLSAKDNKLELTATDLDLTISRSVEAKVIEQGEYTLPVKKLFGLARATGSSQIEMDVSAGHCKIQSGSFSTKLNGLPAEEFPPKPEIKGRTRVRISQEKLRQLLKRTAYAVSADENRYVLNGIFVRIEEKMLTMVATDGRRLAMSEVELEEEAENKEEIIIPTKAVQELTRIMDEEGTIEIQVTDTQTQFYIQGKESARITTKLVEGTYPNYRQVIPKETKHRVSLDKEELLNAVKRAEILTNDKANSVKFTFTENCLTFSSNTPEIGESTETMAIKYTGEETSIAFNPQYFIDPLKTMEEDEIQFEFTDQLSPGVIKVKNPFLYVIMPMRTT